MLIYFYQHKLKHAFLILANLLLVDMAYAETREGNSLLSLSLEELIDLKVVTGTHLKKQSYNEAGSPIDVLTREDLDRDAINGRLVDVLRFLPYNSGNWSSLTPGGDGGPQEGRLGGGSVDFRGLGGGATLVLVNGQRQTSFPLSLDGRVDVNSLAPGIMLDRVEILNDGASAVYGSDAVAGVINAITRHDFEGVEFRLDGRGTYGATNNPFDHNNMTAGVLFGSPKTETVHMVAGFEYFKQDNLVYGDVSQVPVFTNRGASSFGNPGSYVVPVRDDLGLLTGGSTTVADPDCQAVIDANITRDLSFPLTATSLDESANLCRITFPHQPFMLDEERWNGRMEVNWALSDTVKYSGGFGFSRSEAVDVFNATTPVLNFPVVPGEHPANPFVAHDANGNQIFAQDDDDDGVPDRDVNNVVILDPLGIAFNEDVLFRGRPYSSTNFGLVAPLQEIDTMRIESNLDGEYDRWSWHVGWHYSRQQLVRRGPDSVFSQFQRALHGEGGPGHDLYFNPFGSSLLGESFANDPVLAETIMTVLVDNHVTTSYGFDGVMTGEIMALPAGPLAAAIGFQVHSETLSQDFDHLKTIGQVSFFGNGDQDFDAAQKITAIFTEAGIPVFDNHLGKLDVSVAGRYERNNDNSSSSFNPKLSSRYEVDGIAFTGSYATSFLAPSLFQSGGITAQFANVEDPITGTGEQVSTRIIGNKDLEDQKSTSYSFGLSSEIITGIRFEIDYWRFDFQNLIAASLAQSIVDQDPDGPLIDRNSSGVITLINRPFFNAGSIETDGFDVDLSYKIPSATAGQFTFGLQGTLVNRYDVQEQVGGEIFDGVGSDNNNNIGSAIAKLRMNTYVDWHHGTHLVGIIGRYYSDVERVRGEERGVAQACWVFDVRYKYDFGDVLRHNTELEFTLGARNVFNREPSIVLLTDNQYFIGTFQDPAGRVVYASFKLNL